MGGGLSREKLSRGMSSLGLLSGGGIGTGFFCPTEILF